MSSDYDDLKNTGKLDEIIGGLKANLDIAKTIDSPSGKSYQKLAEKYEEALGVIETLRAKIDELQNNKIPSREEVASMSAMLDLLDKFDPKTLEKISRLGSKDD